MPLTRLLTIAALLLGTCHLTPAAQPPLPQRFIVLAGNEIAEDSLKVIGSGRQPSLDLKLPY